MILPHLGHQFPVLSVDSCDASNVLAVLQGLEKLAVSQHEHVLVGHGHLEGVHSFLPHQLLHLSLYLQGGGDVNELFKVNCEGKTSIVWDAGKQECQRTLGPHQVTPTCRA